MNMWIDDAWCWWMWHRWFHSFRLRAETDETFGTISLPPQSADQDKWNGQWLTTRTRPLGWWWTFIKLLLVALNVLLKRQKWINEKSNDCHRRHFERIGKRAVRRERRRWPNVGRLMDGWITRLMDSRRQVSHGQEHRWPSSSALIGPLLTARGPEINDRFLTFWSIFHRNASTWSSNGWMLLLAGDLSIVWHQTVSQSSAGASGWWQWPPNVGRGGLLLIEGTLGVDVSGMSRDKVINYGAAGSGSFLSLSTHTHTQLHTRNTTWYGDNTKLEDCARHFFGPVHRCQFPSNLAIGCF